MSDSIWGNPYDCQIRASYGRGHTEDIEVPEVRIWGVVVRKSYKKPAPYYKELSTDKGDIVPDNVVAERYFKHRCGLIKAINIFSSDSSAVMTLYLDGYHNIVLNIGQIEFKFDPRLENPVVDIFQMRHCTR